MIAGRRWRRIIGLCLAGLVSIGLFVFRVPIIGILFFRPDANLPLAQPVRIADGLIQGTSEDGLTVYKGIPYAAPPVGDLRWRAPQAVAPWQGVLKATAFKPACMQLPMNLPGLVIRSVDEDCLYLNVWTPARSPTDKLAVIVYLYGGGGTTGSGSQRLYWGDQFARKGVVFVTLNYRLGSFGLLALAELSRESGHNASGDYAMLDDIAALQWVRRNIAAFGGDPGNVTLMGQSAGAYHASWLIISPLVRGLFRRVIAQSGGAFGTSRPKGDFPLLADAEQTGVAFEKQLGANSLAELRQLPPAKIVDADSQLKAPDGLVVGSNMENIDGYVVPKGVHAMYLDGAVNDVDLLLGYDAQEGANADSTTRLNAADYKADMRERYGAFADRFLALYPASSDDVAGESQVRRQSDDVAWRMTTWARLHAKLGRKVFLYDFSRVPPFQPYQRLNAAGHGAELGYVFGYPPKLLFYLTEMPWNASRDAALGDAMQTYWTNFAKTGDPNASSLPQWPAFTTDREQLLDLGDAIAPRALANKDAYALMDDYMENLRRAP